MPAEVTMANEPRAYVCPFCGAAEQASCRDRSGRLLQRVHSARSTLARSCWLCGSRAGATCIDDEGAAINERFHQERRSKRPAVRLSLRIFDGRRLTRALTAEGQARCFTTYLFACWLFGDHLAAAANDADSPDHRLARRVLNVHKEVRQLGAKGMEP